MKNKVLLISIILFGFFLRFFKVGEFPVSLSWDEAAIGYNAYSISLTGKDEYAIKFPLLFKSFNDYKLPGYIYLDAFLLKFLEPSELAVRLPSVIFGTISLIAVFFISKRLFDRKIALAATFLLAISPWHLQLSRAAFESNASLTIVLVGLTFFLYGQKGRVFALLSLPILISSLYFYYSPRIFVPLILVVALAIYKKEFVKNYKYYFLGLIIGLVILAPIAREIFSEKGLKRVGEVSVFKEEAFIRDYVKLGSNYSNPFARIFLNRRIPIIFESAHNYFAHFSPGFLFFGDDPNPRHKTSYHGNFYLFEMPLILLGFWQILKSNNKYSKYFLIGWLLVSPIPAAFAKEAPHSLRAIMLLPVIIILSAQGLTTILEKKRIVYLLVPIVLIFFMNYLVSYYLIYPQTNNKYWAFGYKGLYRQINDIEHSFDKIIISGYYWKPYIFYLFYNNVDPNKYFFENQEKIGKYVFGTASWDSGGKNLEESDIEIMKGNKTLIVLSPGEFENLKNKQRFRLISQIKDYSGQELLFKIGEWQ